MDMYVKEGLLYTDDHEAAEVIGVTPLEDYKILVVFETGEKIVLLRLLLKLKPVFYAL